MNTKVQKWGYSRADYQNAGKRPAARRLGAPPIRAYQQNGSAPENIRRLAQRHGADVVGSSLDRFIGSWTREQADEMNRALQDFESIDETIWK